MSLLRWNAKRDASEPDIVRALEQVGALVYRMDVPADLLVWFKYRWHVLEVKARRRNDQPKQDEFRRLTCTPVVATANDALLAVGAIRP